MRPDLKTIDATVLEFSAEFALPSDLISIIKKNANPDNEGDSCFLDSYHNHRSMVVVRQIAKKTDKYTIEFWYQSISGGRLGKRVPRIDNFIQLMSEVKDEVSFECHMSFTFGRNSHIKPIISLPLLSFEASGSPFDRIQGIHLVKTNLENIEYDVYLESPNPRVLIQNIFYKYNSVLNGNISESILKNGKSISERFLVKENKNDKTAN